MLFSFTDAHLVAVLDNQNAQQLKEVWSEAQRIHTEKPGEAVEYILNKLPRAGSAENRFIGQWLIKALQTDSHERIEPYGLNAQDIVEYLPVSALVPRATRSWSELRSDYAASPERKGQRKPDFKTWLMRTQGARFSAYDIKSAVDSLSQVPEEIVTLGYRIRELGSRPVMRNLPVGHIDYQA
jgi:hypothetical protein